MSALHGMNRFSDPAFYELIGRHHDHLHPLICDDDFATEAAAWQELPLACWYPESAPHRGTSFAARCEACLIAEMGMVMQNPNRSMDWVDADGKIGDPQPHFDTMSDKVAWLPDGPFKVVMERALEQVSIRRERVS